MALELFNIPLKILVAYAWLGLFFGIYPARCVALLNPIDALHYQYRPVWIQHVPGSIVGA